jgi:hypothetical protein
MTWRENVVLRLYLPQKLRGETAEYREDFHLM